MVNTNQKVALLFTIVLVAYLLSLSSKYLHLDDILDYESFLL